MWKKALLITSVMLVAVVFVLTTKVSSSAQENSPPRSSADLAVETNGAAMIMEGRRTFRFDTFGDEAYWGDTLGLHKAIEGARLGGVGGGVSPATALAVGLKVDVDALPPALIEAL